VVKPVAVGAFRDMSVDVLPEFSPTESGTDRALGLSASEVEQLLTVPLESDLLNGVPWLTAIESGSMPGLSSIVLHFEPGTDSLKPVRSSGRQVVTQAKALPNVS
jgi:Cu/Ag efflux pump CusA